MKRLRDEARSRSIGDVILRNANGLLQNVHRAAGGI